jgi:hypothetical protein
MAALLLSIGRADRYLAGWKASLLNTMGRAVLADSVLGNLLIYANGAAERGAGPPRRQAPCVPVDWL